MKIAKGDLADPGIIELLARHLARSRAETARGSAHALDRDGLRAPEIDVWAIWDGDVLLGVGALKRLSSEHGEVKSMHIVEARRRTGAGSAMLRHIIAEARKKGMSRLSLETGSWAYFQPAVALYRKHGFVDCPPFAGYAPDPNSVFLSLNLRQATPGPGAGRAAAGDAMASPPSSPPPARPA